jgi:hypothetical protein
MDRFISPHLAYSWFSFMYLGVEEATKRLTHPPRRIAVKLWRPG